MSEAEKSLSTGQGNAPVASAPEGRKKRILIIEDQGPARLTLWEKFRNAGFDIDQAVNGIVAMEKLRAVTPDAIFMDLLLPYIKGVDVIKEARRDKKFANSPIYVCTSAAMMAMWKRRGTKAGATKVFDRGGTPIDDIVAEVTADLRGTKPKPVNEPKPVAAVPLQKSESVTDIPENIFFKQKAPEKISAKVTEKPKPEIQPGAAKLPAKSFNPMKFLKGLRLGKKTETPTPPLTPPKAAPAAEKTTAPATPSTPVPANAAQPPVPNQVSVSAGTPKSLNLTSAPSTAKNQPVQPGPRLETGTTAFVNFNTVAVLTVDHYGKIASADGPCLKMFGWQPVELVGRNLESLLKESSRGDLRAFVEQVQSDFSNQLASVQVTALRKSGAEFPASITRLAWSSETSVMTKSATAEAVWTAVFRDLSSSNSAPVLVPPSVTLPASPLAEAPAAPPMQFSAARDLRGAEGTQTSLRHASEELRKRIEVASAEATRHREALEKAQQERDELATRIDAQETELNRARDAAGRESETRKLLEQQLQNLQTAKAELEKQISEQRRSKEDVEKASEQFRTQLGEAKSAADRAQAAHDQEVARVRSLEENLARLRTEYEDAASNLTAEQRAAAESTRQVEELETRLRESTVEAERLKDELVRAAADRNRLEAEWQEQLSAAKAAAAKAEAAWLEEAGRNRNFEERLRVIGNSLQMEQAQRAQAVFGQELADLREVRDELNTKLAAEQQASGEIRRRAEDLEGSLRRRTAEVEHIKADKDRQAAERQRLEAEWQTQLNTAETLTKKLEVACQEITERNKRFEEEVAGLRQSQGELENKLTTERQKAAESKKRIEELKRLLRQNEAELERAKAELAKADQNKRHETELTSLYQVRDELSGKLATEQKATQDSKERTDELENRLRQNNADLERIKAERESHARRQAALRSELESKLSAAKAAGERAEKLVKEKTALCTRLEKQFAKVQQSRDELNGLLSSERQAVAESRRKCEEVEGRLRESTAELEKLKAEREKEAVAQASLESQLEAELNKAKNAAEKAEASRLQEVEQSNRLKLEREELGNKYAAEKQAAAEAKRRNKELETQLRENAAELERVAANRDKQSHKAATLESQLKDQVNAVKVAPEKKEGTAKEKNSDVKRLEQEVANLRRERQELHNKCLAEKQDGTKSRHRVKELEKQLREIAGGFTTTKLELDKRAADRGRLEGNLQEQLKTAAAAVEQAQAALKEQTLRADLLQQELTEVCQAREELRAEVRSEQQKTLETVQRIDEFEARLRESAGELARTKAAAENNAVERQRLESVQGEFADNAEDLIKDLSRLRENEAGQAAEIRELERRVREGVASIARVTADLEKERGERRRVEQRLASLTQQLEDLHQDLSQHLESERASQTKITELEQQLRERERALARVLADLRKEVADRELAEQQLESVGDMSAQLRQYLSLFEDSKKVFKRTHEQLESKVQASQKALSESEAKLQREVNERQRLQEEMTRIQRSLDEQAERVSLDVARLESELQVEQLERKRVEGDAQQSRYASLDSARVARSMVNTLRRQAQDAVDNLMQVTRRLLEITSEEEPKKLVESVLEYAALLETNLHQSGPTTDSRDDSSETRAAA